ncbi:MAG: twin-arginine translocase subunit TatC [Ilumatobacteraceae bacterium]
MAFRRIKSVDPTDENMTLVGHLAELRMRIVRCLLAIAIGAAGILIFYDQVLQFLTKPYRNLCETKPDLKCNGSLFALGPIEGLAQRMRIAGYGGLIIALPVIFWQLWRFIVPALNKREKRYTIPFIVSSILLFALGGVLAYWTLDKALEFLISWSGKDVTQAYQISKYVSLVALMVLAFGVGFLVPVLVVFLQLVGVVTPRTLIKQWRYSILGVFVTAAVITPSGDPISMMALAIPMTLLFLLAILIGYIVERRRTKQSA